MESNVKYEIYNKSFKNNWNLNIIFDSISDAYRVLDAMISISENKGKVSMYEYFSLAGIPDSNEELTKCLYWTKNNICNSRIIRSDYGYKIDVPRTVIIQERSEPC